MRFVDGVSTEPGLCVEDHEVLWVGQEVLWVMVLLCKQPPSITPHSRCRDDRHFQVA